VLSVCCCSYDVPLHHYWPGFLHTTTPRPAPLPHPLASPPASPLPPPPSPIANETALFEQYEHKRGVTLRHVLSHSWGLHTAVPASTPPSSLMDPLHCQQALSVALPAFAPGSKAVHDVTLMGHAAAALVREVGGGLPLPVAVTDRLTRPLHIQVK
jgi:CubicO group peptidase (beta-lactamase class C family)